MNAMLSRIEILVRRRERNPGCQCTYSELEIAVADFLEAYPDREDDVLQYWEN